MNNTFSPYKSLINVDLPTLLSPKIIRLAERASELTFTGSMFNKSSTVIFFINNYLLLFICFITFLLYLFLSLLSLIFIVLSFFFFILLLFVSIIFIYIYPYVLLLYNFIIFILYCQLIKWF